MQITIPQPVLARELTLVAAVAARKTTIPILSSVKLEAADGELTITGTDLETGLIATVDAGVQKPGSICLPAKRLLDFVTSLSGDVTIMTDDKNYATVKAGKARARIPGESAESFPQLPTPPDPIATIEARAFAAQVERVRFAISVEESRFALKGALVVFTGDALVMVATDGHRLAYATTEVKAVASRFILPLYSMPYLAKVLDAAGAAAVSQDDNHLFFVNDNHTAISRKLSGSFPDFERIMVTNYAANLTVDGAELKAAISSVRQFGEHRSAKDVSHTVALKLTPTEILVSATQVDIGECENSAVCEYSGAEVVAGFDPDYITEFLTHAGSEKVEACVRGAKDAFEWRAAGKSDYRYVVMGKKI